MKMWINFKTVSDYNNSYGTIGNFLGVFRGNDPLILCIAETKQQFACSVTISNESVDCAKRCFGAENVAVTQTAPIESPAVPEQKNETVNTEKEEKKEDSTSESVKDVVEPTEDAAVSSENVSEPEKSDESKDVSAAENDENTIYERGVPVAVIGEDESITWIYPEGTGLEVFKSQLDAFMEASEKKARDIKMGKDEDAQKFRNICDAALQQGRAWVEYFYSFVSEEAKNEDFEKALAYPWKSFDRMWNTVVFRMKELARFGLMGLRGKDENLREQAPFSWIVEYYLTDNKAAVEEDILKTRKDKIKAKKAAEEQKKKEAESKKKKNQKAINDIAKEIVEAELENDESFKALDDKGKKKKVSSLIKEKKYQDLAKAEKKKRDVLSKLRTKISAEITDELKDDEEFKKYPYSRQQEIKKQKISERLAKEAEGLVIEEEDALVVEEEDALEESSIAETVETTADTSSKYSSSVEPDGQMTLFDMLK